MLLQELFDNLAAGEFANLAVGNSITGSITEASYPKMVSHINMGLREIYKRFLLKKKECTLYQQEGVTTYYLRSTHVGYVGSMGPDVYIEDVYNDTFDDDVIKVLEAYDSLGDSIPVNDPRKQNVGILYSAADSVDIRITTLAFDTIKMVPCDPLQAVTLVYQASHPKIVITEDFNPATYQLYFPDFIETALMAFIASRLYKGKASKAVEGEVREYNTFFYQFEKACKEIKDLGLAEELLTEENGFERKGWV